MDLIKACKVGNLEEVKRLEEEGADIRIGRQAILRWAVLEGNLELVKYLVENGADIHAKDEYVINYAVESGHLEVIKYLIEAGADVRKVDIEELVSGRKYKDVLCLLLDRLSKEELMPLLESSNNRLRKAVKAYIKRRKIR
jgi:ankyrin repeat protein